MCDSAFFKVKSSKRSNPEARTTLDAIHNQKIQNMNDKKDNLNIYKNELEVFNKKIRETTSDIEIWRLERQAELLEKKIKIIEDGSEFASQGNGFPNVNTGHKGRFVSVVKIRTPAVTDPALIERLRSINNEINKTS